VELLLRIVLHGLGGLLQWGLEEYPQLTILAWLCLLGLFLFLLRTLVPAMG
jgi:hypothetical protein